MESLSPFLPKYARYVTVHDVGYIAHLTRGCNSCILITLLIGISALTFPKLLFVTLSHRDCTRLNIMLDPANMYPDSFHPVDMRRSKDFRHKVKGYSRTWRPTRYFLIDFGLSRRYDPADGPPLDDPLRGGDSTAPEHQDGKTPCNPFPTDVYYLGNLVRRYYIQVRVFSSFIGYLPDQVPRSPKGSSSLSHLSQTWCKIILGSAPTWMKLFLGFPRSRASSLHGSYAPELPVGMRFGWLRPGGLSAIGTEPWATSSQTERRLLSRNEQFCLLAL
jgi:hypothetical protein